MPDAVRRALKLGKRDKIRYLVHPDGSVLTAGEAAALGDDPVLGNFLSFLAHDIETHLGRVRGLDARLAKRIRSLAKSVKVYLDAGLIAENE